MVESISLKYRTRLYITKEEAEVMKVVVFLRSMTNMEYKICLLRNIRQMEGKFKGGCTTQVRVASNKGEVIEHTLQKPIEKSHLSIRIIMVLYKNNWKIWRMIRCNESPGS